jgi:hypothetical protein
MEHFASAYNALEVAVWGIIGVALLVIAARKTGASRNRLGLAGVLFLLFAASDAVEISTGAWWRPWWLLAWKATCVIGLVVIYALQRRSKATRK